MDVLQKFKPKNNLCLEFAAGGPLQVFDNILKSYYHTVDINDIAREQMLTTYESEIQIKYSPLDVGKIGDRFQCNLKDLAMLKKYDLLYGHWCLGYLK